MRVPGYEEEMQQEEDPEIRAAVEAALAAQHPPPPWVDVTVAVRYLLKDSRVMFHTVHHSTMTAHLLPMHAEMPLLGWTFYDQESKIC